MRSCGWEAIAGLAVVMTVALGVGLDRLALVEAGLAAATVLIPLVLVSLAVRILARIVHPYLLARALASRAAGRAQGRAGS